MQINKRAKATLHTKANIDSSTLKIKYKEIDVTIFSLFSLLFILVHGIKYG